MSVTGAMDFKQTRSKRDMVSHTHTHTRTHARTHTICGSSGGLHAHTHTRVCARTHTQHKHHTHHTTPQSEGGGGREREFVGGGFIKASGPTRT